MYGFDFWVFSTETPGVILDLTKALTLDFLPDTVQDEVYQTAHEHSFNRFFPGYRNFVDRGLISESEQRQKQECKCIFSVGSCSVKSYVC